MIDVNNEQLVRLAEAARLLPERPNIATLWRWRTAGVRGVKLETLLVGGRRYTSREALVRFITASTAAADGQPVTSRKSRQREADQRRAREELVKEGLMNEK